MPYKVFVNLPVKDVTATIAFWEALGFAFNPQFTGETAACMVLSDDGFVMFLVESHFRQFTPLEIADTSKVAQVLVALSCEDRASVDRIADAAAASGGRSAHEPQDYGFMYQRAFYDRDGHGWSVNYMNPNFVQPQ